MRILPSSRLHNYQSSMRTLTYKRAIASSCLIYGIKGFSPLHGSSLHRSHPGGGTASSVIQPHHPQRHHCRSKALFSSFPSKHQTPEETQMTQDCLGILKAAIQAVDPVVAIQKHFHHLQESSFRIGERVYDLSKYERVLVVGFGKASSAMAAAVVQQLQQAEGAFHKNSKIAGLIIVKDGHATALEQQVLSQNNIQVREAGHPVPDRRSVDASNELLDLVSRRRKGLEDLENTNETTQASSQQLIIACISGGGSSLFCAPQSPLTLQDLQATNQVLLQSGWPIQDMNVVRKRLERGKGGRLAEAAFPHSDVVSLILSDVLGDPLDLIASGPTVPDSSTWTDAWKLLGERLPPPLALPDVVMELLQQGTEGRFPDSPSHDHPVFQRCHNVLVGNNEAAVMAAAIKSKELGYNPVVLGTQIVGEASHVAKTLVSLAQHVRQGPERFSVAPPPAALITGGETTVTIPQGCTGTGGRNQEMALVAAQALKDAGLRQIIFSSIGTDGTDGPNDAAGAIVDGNTIDRLAGNADQAIANHDAYNYLAQTDDIGMSPLIKTGPTGTNVADVSVILIGSKE